MLEDFDIKTILKQETIRDYIFEIRILTEAKEK